MGDVTRILDQVQHGDHAAAEDLLPLVYEELRRLAAIRLVEEKPSQTLQASALVHEVWLRLVGPAEGHAEPKWNDRLHFFRAASGAVSAYAERVPLATNFVLMTLTNVVPVFETNMVNLAVTNLVAKPEAEATIAAVGGVVNTFAPGIGTIVALALGGLYHGYRQVRNRKVNEALIQGVETARTVLTTTPQGW